MLYLKNNTMDENYYVFIDILFSQTLNINLGSCIKYWVLHLCENVHWHKSLTLAPPLLDPPPQPHKHTDVHTAGGQDCECLDLKIDFSGCRQNSQLGITKLGAAALKCTTMCWNRAMRCDTHTHTHTHGRSPDRPNRLWLCITGRISPVLWQPGCGFAIQ